MGNHLLLIGIGFIFAGLLTKEKKENTVKAPDANSVPIHENQSIVDNLNSNSGIADGSIDRPDEEAAIHSIDDITAED